MEQILVEPYRRTSVAAQAAGWGR